MSSESLIKTVVDFTTCGVIFALLNTSRPIASCLPIQLPQVIVMMSLQSIFLVVVALVLQVAVAADFELESGKGTIRYEDRDPFKEGYFVMTISCFAFAALFVACGFGVRSAYDKSRNRDSRSFFLVA
ncbi:unnamed protein product [Choristocarpus tenellus]